MRVFDLLLLQVVILLYACDKIFAKFLAIAKNVMRVDARISRLLKLEATLYVVVYEAPFGKK